MRPINILIVAILFIQGCLPLYLTNARDAFLINLEKEGWNTSIPSADVGPGALLKNIGNGETQYIGTLRYCAPNSKFILTRNSTAAYYPPAILNVNQEKLKAWFPEKNGSSVYRKIAGGRITFWETDAVKLELDSLLSEGPTVNSPLYGGICAKYVHDDDVYLVTETLFPRDARLVIYDTWGKSLSVEDLYEVLGSERSFLETRYGDREARISGLPIAFKTSKLANHKLR
jgi:hypothetical protein